MNIPQLKKFDPTIKIVFGETDQYNLVGISSSHKPEDYTFIFIKNARFFKSIGRLSTKNTFLKSGILFEDNFYESIKDSKEIEEVKLKFSWFATVENVAKSMCLLSKPFYDLKYLELNYYVDGRQMGSAEVDPSAQVAQNAFIGTDVIIGKNVKIHPGVVIMPKVVIGDGTIIFPNVTVYPYSEIGSNCRIHSSTVIGGDGFGYNFYDGEHQKIWHLAGVIIEDNVEIGGATMVDAGAFIPTRVGEGTKLDNFCQISHNAQIGKYCVFAGQAGASGSGEVGDYCAFGAGAGLAPGAILGDSSKLAARSIISENSIWPAKSILGGHPARPLKEWLRSQAKVRQLIKK